MSKRDQGGDDIDYQMAQNVASIDGSLREIAESSKATAAILNKWDKNGLPRRFCSSLGLLAASTRDSTRSASGICSVVYLYIRHLGHHAPSWA